MLLILLIPLQATFAMQAKPPDFSGGPRQPAYKMQQSDFNTANLTGNGSSFSGNKTSSDLVYQTGNASAERLDSGNITVQEQKTGTANPDDFSDGWDESIEMSDFSGNTTEDEETDYAANPDDFSGGDYYANPDDFSGGEDCTEPYSSEDVQDFCLDPDHDFEPSDLSENMSLAAPSDFTFSPDFLSENCDTTYPSAACLVALDLI